MVFKKRNGISPIKPLQFFFFWITTLLNSCWMKLFNIKVKPHFVHLLLWHEKCRALNLIQYFSSYLDPSVCPRIHAFCPQFRFSTNHHWSSFIHCFWYVWNQLINFGHHFLYVRSRFFFSIINPWPGFLWFFFSTYKLSVNCFKMFGTLNWFKRPETWDPFFMKSYFIFVTYLNSLSMQSSLNFF